MSKLLDQQMRFMDDQAQLVQRVRVLGYASTGGELKRMPAQAKANATDGCGIADSVHLESLAIDLNLFKKAADGSWVYITDDEGHKELGAWWKALSPDHRWGGDFSRRDFNHYSITPDGVRA